VGGEKGPKVWTGTTLAIRESGPDQVADSYDQTGVSQDQTGDTRDELLRGTTKGTTKRDIGLDRSSLDGENNGAGWENAVAAFRRSYPDTPLAEVKGWAAEAADAGAAPSVYEIENVREAARA
jgi:hypothetical protein